MGRVTGVLAATALLVSAIAFVPAGAAEPTAAQCLARASVSVKTGTTSVRWKQESFPNDHTFDARGYTNIGYPFTSAYPVSLGLKDAGGVPSGLCIVGGRTIGQQPEDWTWNQVHDDYHGGGLRTYTSDTVSNGWRIRNTADGYQPRDGEDWTLINSYFEYIRDDCIENDDRLGGAVYDSLFDGCYTGLSEQDAGSVAGETLILDGVLMRLEPMPGPYGTNDPTILGHGSFFKKFNDGGRHAPVIRNSIFVAEKFRESTPKNWPPGTTMSNVTVVWLGTGPFPMSTLPGMTLTTDRSVWNQARADWLARHGCTGFNSCTGALYAPSGTPSPSPTISPSPSVEPSPSVSPSPTC